MHLFFRLLAIILWIAAGSSESESEYFQWQEDMQLGKGAIRALAYSPGGERLAVAASTGVWLYSADLEPIAQFERHTEPVLAVAWSQDGKQLFSGGADGSVLAWNPETGKSDWVMRPQTDQVASIKPTDDGRLLFLNTGLGLDHERRVWDTEAGEALFSLGKHINTTAWTTDGANLASSGTRGTIQIWDTATGENFLTLEGHTEEIGALAWAPGGKMLASGDEDGLIGIWTIAGTPNQGKGITGERLFTLTGSTSSVKALSWSLDGTHLAGAYEDGSVHIWMLSGGAARRAESLAPPSPHQGVVDALAWSPDGNHLASSGGGGLLQIWEIASAESHASISDHAGPVWSVTWSPDGDYLISGNRYSTIWVWDAASGEPIAILQGHARDVTASITWSGSSDTRLASASLDSTIRLWDISDLSEGGEPTAILKGHAGPVWSVAWSSDAPHGARLASAGADGHVIVWDIEASEPIAILEQHTGQVWSVAWSTPYESNKNLRLASGGQDKSVRIWEVAHRSSRGTVRQTAVLQGQEYISAVVWASDGVHLASASWDKSIYIWRVPPGPGAQQAHVVRILKGHTDRVRGVDWLPGTDLLASASSDNTVRIWNAKTGVLLATLEGHKDDVYAVAWLDANTLASASWDGTVRIWKNRPE